MIPEAKSFDFGHSIDASKGFNKGLDELLSKLKGVTHLKSRYRFQPSYYLNLNFGKDAGFNILRRKSHQMS